jgi:membrane protein YdbS with pleckstrin-like domain
MPFLDFDSAARMRDLLIKESGKFYRVEQYEREIDDMTGFVVVRNDTPPCYISQGTDQPIDENITNSVDDIESGVANINAIVVREYRPALRSYFMYFPLFFACLCLFVFAYELWSLILSIIGVDVSSSVVNMGLLVKISQALAAAILFFNLLSMLYSYYSIVLIVDNEGVSLRKGIIAREFISIRFSEIKTIGVKQGILARLLNVGNLEFASSGSDGVDIIFTNIVNPGATKNHINNRVTCNT